MGVLLFFRKKKHASKLREKKRKENILAAKYRTDYAPSLQDKTSS